MSGADVLDDLLNQAPELQTAPGLAVAAANSADPNGTGQALAHTVNTNAQDQAVATVAKKVGHPNLLHRSLNWLGGSISKVASGAGNAVSAANDELEKIPGVKAADQAIGNIGSGALKLANVPLSEVQHTYRALHDIEARHGPVVGLLEALGIAAGATGAALAAPLTGGGSLVAFGAGTAAILGGEAAADVGSRVLYHDSWDRTKNGPAYQGIYNRQTGQYSGGPVSLGRDLAAHLPHPLRFMSGITDGLADLTLDPLQVVGGGLADVRKAALTINTADGLDAALANPMVGRSINRAFDEIGRSSAADVMLRYPKFKEIAGDLGKLDSGEQVADYFRTHLASAEFLSSTPGVGASVPNLPLTKIPFKEAQNFVRSYAGPGQAILRRFTLLPTALDKETLELSGKSFDPSSNEFGNVVYRTARYSQSDRVARQLADSALAISPGDLANRRVLWKNVVAATGQAMGFNNDDRFMREFMQRFENSTPVEGGVEGVYATDAAGRNTSKLAGEFGDHSAAVLENQTGKWAIPDFTEMNNARRALEYTRSVEAHAIDPSVPITGRLSAALGAIDDGFYHHFTQPIFKTGALLTVGFAARIAAAEAIPATFREGFYNLVKSSVQLHAGANEARIGAEEGGHIAAAVGKLLDFARKPMLNPDDVDLATRAVIDNGGHLVSKTLDADAHGNAGVSFLDTPEGNRTTLLQRMFKQVPVGKTFGDQFGIVGAGPDHAPAWQAALSEASQSELATTAAQVLRDELQRGATLEEATQASTDRLRNILDAKDDKFLTKYERHFTSSTPGVEPHDDWGRVVTDYVKGLVGHPYDPNAVKMDVLDDLAQGKVTKLDTLKGFAPAEVPMVKRRIEAPPTFEGPIQKIAQMGSQHVIDPMINFLSREPIYFNALKKEYAPLKALIADGTLGEDEALRIAQIRTVNAVTPFIHNPLERSQFAQLARNFMPFYFAQTQAYRRVGRLFLDDPGAFRKFQLASTGLHDIGSVTTDENGKPQFIYPGSGFLAHASIGALGMLGFPVAGSTPVAFSGDVRSLNTVFPFNEEAGGIGIGPVSAKFGPIVSIPMHALQSLFPEVGVPLSNAVLGPVGASQGFDDQFIPNTPLRNLLKAQGLLPGSDRSLQNAMVQTIQSLSYQQAQAMAKWVKAGHQPTDEGAPNIVPSPSALPMERQQFIDRVKMQSRILLYLKAGLSTVVPAAPQVSASDLGLQKELRDLIASKGPDGKPIGLSGAITEFLHRHPDATPYTVFGSKSEALGAFLPANKPAQEFIDNHLDLMKKYPYAGAWLIPQTSDPYDQTVYQQQLAMGLRSKKAPDQVVKDIYIAQGNQLFFADLPIHQKALADAKASGDPAAVTAENKSWNDYLTNTLGAQNPVWWDHFQSKDAQHERENAVTQLQAMFQNGDAPPGPQTALVKSLLDDYRTYNAAKIAGRQDSWSAEQRDAEKANWQAYIDQLAKDEPAIAPLALKVFRSL